MTDKKKIKRTPVVRKYKLLRIPRKPNPTTMELLIRAKLFLSHALSHSIGTSSPDRMVAIHGLDNTIENTLRIIVDFLEIETITGKRLDTPELAVLAGEVNRFLMQNYNISLPYFSDIKKLRQIRNMVQHGIVDPITDIKRLSSMTERYFDSVLHNIFGLNREELRISSLVKSDNIKRHLISAEKYIDSNNYVASIIASRDAYENACFENIRHSGLRNTAVPVLVQTSKNELNKHWFFEDLVSKYELLTNGIDISKYDRFKEYIKHIPTKFCVDSSSYAIMQRPWERKDAFFCYNFVANSIIKWQMEKMEPLYNIDLSGYINNKSKYILNGIDVTSAIKGGCIYAYPNEEEIELFYADKLLYDKMKKLVPGRVYTYEYEALNNNNQLEKKGYYKLELLNNSIRLLVNNPERWEIVLWYKRLPFTWHLNEYENGKIIKKVPSINNATIKELVEVNKYTMNTAIAKKIIALKKVKKRIKSVNDLKSIHGITDEQINSLVAFTHI